MSWKGILAGAFCTTAFGDLLVMLGIAVGLTAYDPHRVGWNGVVGILGGGAWTTLAIVLATLAGAFVSTRATPDIGREDAVLQGIVTWAVAFEATLLVMMWVSVVSSVAAAITNVPPVAAGPIPQLTPGQAANALEGAAWWFVITGVLGAAAGAVGGLAGAEGVLPVRRHPVAPRGPVIEPRGPIVEGPL